MNLPNLRRCIINLFLDIKTKLFIMIDDSNSQYYSSFLCELTEILSHTLSKIEDIYYKYFLLPKLQAMALDTRVI